MIRNPTPEKIEFASISSSGYKPPNNKAKAVASYQCDNTAQIDDSDDDDDDDNDGNNEGTFNPNMTKKNGKQTTLGLRAEIEKKCRSDIKFKCIELCAIAQHGNYQTIFNIETIKQMVRF